MNRIKDYAGFATWFAGLGYIVLWPVTSPDLGGKPFGASIFCRDGSLSLLDLLCNSAHPLQLPAGLHVIGFISAVLVTIRLLLYAIRRARRAAATRAADAAARAVRIPVAPPRPPQQQPPQKSVRPLRPVKPRTHFGLRGMPR
jgi:hypothetical protein